MNPTFDFRRWWLLIIRHWIENSKRYLLALLAIFGLILVWFAITLTMPNYNPLPGNIQFVTYMVGLYFIGCFYASTFFDDLGNTPKGINYLSVPASLLEKLLCAIFYGVVLFFLLYTIIFYLVDVPMLKLANAVGFERYKAGDQPTGGWKPDEVINLLNLRGIFNDDSFIYFFAAYFPIQSAFILGSVYFKRYAFIKTALVLLILWAVVFIFSFKILSLLLPPGWGWQNLAEWRPRDYDNTIRLVRLTPWVEELFDFLLRYGTVVFLYVITYFRLKEKEI